MIIDGKKVNGTILLSVPRLMFTANFNSILNSVVQCGFRVITGEGVYWDQTGSGAIEQVLDSEYIIIVDYDTIFTAIQLKKMLEIINSRPDIDIIFPIQVSRHNNHILCYNSSIDYSQPLTKMKLGHFGCTIIRSSVFKKLDKPWFIATPNSKGEWKEGKIDADISFWLNCEKNGINVYSANDVVVGHLELFIKWPVGTDTITVQQTSDYNRRGIPPEVHYAIKPNVNSGFNLKL